jgi:chemotaxis protein methyltransferase CheR
MEVATGRKLLIPAGIQVLLRDLIHERTGIFFDSGRLDVLVEKLEPLALARNCYSLLDYYYLLKYEENGVEDWARVMDALSVQETYFWREMAQIRVLTDTVIPEWFQKSSMPLQIWSAACATGEEPYSILMAILEAGWGGHPIEIRGSDGSPSALEKCRAATYREKSFRCFPPNLRDKYFTAAGKQWTLRPEIAGRVTFQRANLLATEEISPLARARVIFCRNVFIYFSPHAIRQTLATFASRMPSGGHLFVGAAESLLRLTADFELKELADTFVYVRS